jgi:hypothetical protein
VRDWALDGSERDGCRGRRRRHGGRRFARRSSARFGNDNVGSHVSTGRKRDAAD